MVGFQKKRFTLAQVSRWSFSVSVTLIAALLIAFVSMTQSRADHRTEFAPLVTELTDSFQVNPTFTENLDALIAFNALSTVAFHAYEKNGLVPGPDDSHFVPFQENGWIIRGFEGVSGSYQADLPGLVSSNIEKKIIIVTLHFSASGADWISNLNAIAGTRDVHGLPIPGRIHTGFAVKVKEFENNMLQAVSQALETFPKSQWPKIQFFVTGFSHGGGLAPLVAVRLIDALQTMIKPFDNATTNRVQVYTLGTPRVAADAVSHAYIEGKFGKHNHIRQNVQFDPVSSAPSTNWLRRAVHEYLPSLEAFIEISIKFVGDYRSTGYLAIQYAMPTISSGINRIGAWDENSPMSTLARVLGPCHFGSVQDNPGGTFDPNLVEHATPKLLLQGREYKRN